MSRWQWIYHHDGNQTLTLRQVGVDADGSLYNPNGYSEHIVREALAAAEERDRQRRSDGAKKAAITRRRRIERRVYAIAQRILRNENCGPRHKCAICGRGLDDPESIQRGIGSECWQGVLQIVSLAHKTSQNAA
jgi:Family of unknown function (DUF6011)